jgi:hypothetical protein
MKHEFVILEEAHEEILSAYHWYEDQKAGLGEKFLKHLDNVYKRIDKTLKFIRQFLILSVRHRFKAFHT